MIDVSFNATHPVQHRTVDKITCGPDHILLWLKLMEGTSLVGGLGIRFEATTETFQFLDQLRYQLEEISKFLRSYQSIEEVPQ